MNYIPDLDWGLWAMSVLGVVIMLSAGTLVLMSICLIKLPPNPTRIQRIRYALWDFL